MTKLVYNFKCVVVSRWCSEAKGGEAESLEVASYMETISSKIFRIENEWAALSPFRSLKNSAKRNLRVF